MNPSGPLRTLTSLTFLLIALPIRAAAPQDRPPPKAESPRAALQKLTVFPEKIALNGPRDEQRLGVIGEYADGRRWDLSREATFSIDDEQVAQVDATGTVRPAGNGRASLTVRAAGQSVEVRVRVRGAEEETPVSYTREVLPVLTRAGCNQGACHGSSQGRGGFRLSLFGFDPTFDYAQIVQSAEGRRVVPSDPEKSILLLKPTLQLEHGGGERFRVRSRSYEVLRRWLEDGPRRRARKTRTSSGSKSGPPRA